MSPFTSDVLFSPQTHKNDNGSLPEKGGFEPKGNKHYYTTSIHRAGHRGAHRVALYGYILKFAGKGSQTERVWFQHRFRRIWHLFRHPWWWSLLCPLSVKPVMSAAASTLLNHGTLREDITGIKYNNDIFYLHTDKQKHVKVWGKRPAGSNSLFTEKWADVNSTITYDLGCSISEKARLTRTLQKVIDWTKQHRAFSQVLFLSIWGTNSMSLHSHLQSP